MHIFVCFQELTMGWVTKRHFRYLYMHGFSTLACEDNLWYKTENVHAWNCPVRPINVLSHLHCTGKCRQQVILRMMPIIKTSNTWETNNPDDIWLYDKTKTCYSEIVWFMYPYIEVYFISLAPGKFMVTYFSTVTYMGFYEMCRQFIMDCLFCWVFGLFAWAIGDFEWNATETSLTGWLWTKHIPEFIV